MHLFVQLCRKNNKSEKSKVVSAFESSVKSFDNIFGNIFSRINTVLLKLQNFAFKPEVSKMGGNFRFHNGLNLLCRVWPSGQHPKRRMLRSQLDALYDFKICSQFLKIAIFEKIVKILFLQNCQLF